MQEQGQTFYIKGQTLNGDIFRPSDWVERLCGIMSQFTPIKKCNKRLSYSPYVQPSEIDGIKSVLVDKRLGDIEPKALDFLYCFAENNNLPIIFI